MSERGADRNAQGGRYGPDLIEAARAGNTDLVNLLLDNGVDVNIQHGKVEFLGTALQAAAYGRHLDLVKLLLDRGADTNLQGGFYGCALQTAVDTEALDIVKLLLDCGADINTQSEYHGSALQAAAHEGALDTVKLLLDYGADVNAPAGCYGNALQAAASTGTLDIVKLLLDHGADSKAQGGDYGNALQAAASTRSGALDIVKLLLNHGADVNAQGGYYGNALQAAAFTGALDTIKLLLDYGADVNTQGGYYGNALQAAASTRSGALDIVKLLLNHGADVNAQGGYYGNALQAAAFTGALDTVKLLLDCGVDVNTQGGNFGNALQAAATAKGLDTVNLLLERGADATVRPDLVNSLLHVSAASNNLALLEILCNAGADVHLSSQDNFGRTPLHLAVDNGHVTIAKYLLGRGASPDIEDLGDTNSFQLAMRNGNSDMVLLLYPKTTAGLSSISASDWRRCSGHALNCNLEMISDGSAKVIFGDESLRKDLEQMSYPLFFTNRELNKEIAVGRTDFMHTHRNGTRIFILADGSMLYPEQAIDVHCHWWCKVPSDPFWPYWTVRKETAPSLNAVRQRLPEDCYLECALCFTCYALPENMGDWPNIAQLTANPLGESMSRQGIMWIMMKSQAPEDYDQSRKPVLQSRIFFSTSEYAEIPQMATDLLNPLVKKIQSIWEQNFQRFQKRFGLMRARILRSSGTDPDIIQELLNDAQLLEVLRENLTKQIDTLQKFRFSYQSESWRASHELPLDEVRKEMVKLESASYELQTTTERFLKSLTESSQNMIQLEFNLTSITEAQRSTSTNKSMKRLTWITFIFLPLLFIASLFGMNVDILKNNPAWWWYFPFAAFTTLGTFVVWVIFKRSKLLEDSLEKRFRWLFPQQEGERDLEKGSPVSPEARRAKTIDFPASGKKRS